MFLALCLSFVTAGLFGWFAYRGSGHWWTGFAAGTAAWGLATVVPILIGGMFVMAATDASAQDFVASSGAVAIVIGNLALLGYAAYMRRSS